MSRVVLFALPLLLVASACSKKAARPDDLTENLSQPAVVAEPEPEKEEAVTGASARKEEPPPPRPLSMPVIYFEFDSFTINAAGRDALDRFASEVKARGGAVQVVIEGHADERGTEEYNLVLGERRASAVRSYLTRMGLSAGTLRTVSYGEARPARRGSSEDAWSQNRRAELKVQETLLGGAR